MTSKKKVKAKASNKTPIEKSEVTVTVDLRSDITKLTERIEKLEKKQTILVDSIKFVADQARPMYGLTPIAMIFDAVYEKLTK